MSETVLTQLLTPAELAERWQCSSGHLANMRSAGVGPVYLKLGSSIRYRVSDVQAYEQSCEVASLTSR